MKRSAVDELFHSLLPPALVLEIENTSRLTHKNPEVNAAKRGDGADAFLLDEEDPENRYAQPAAPELFSTGQKAGFSSHSSACPLVTTMIAMIFRAQDNSPPPTGAWCWRQDSGSRRKLAKPWRSCET